MCNQQGVLDKAVRFRRNVFVRQDLYAGWIDDLRRSTIEDSALSRTPKPPKPWHPA